MKQGTKLRKKSSSQRGMSLLELLTAVSILLIITAVTSPLVMLTVYNFRLRGAASDLAGLMQQTRITAARQNVPNGLPIRFTTVGNRQLVYIDLNSNSTWNSTEPQIEFTGTVAPASGAPTGSGGQPSPYVLVGDTSTGSVYTNSTVLGFSSRGLPCAYDATTTPPTCSTPATNYFVYYLTDLRMGTPGWAAVVVTKSGRTRAVVWDGGSWH